ncbi:MAG: LytTR family DNA-binding domain-containing protein [Lachnospiraceae bacterium]|nr:LytTR family DNA-binding domain-containing protein [Lachnospiraceae bacterium]
MSYRIAICDDSAADRTYIQSLIRIWAKEQTIFIQTEEFPSAESFLFCYDSDKNWDILLLDIEMGNMDGVSLAKKLRQDNETLQIVFITGYSDYIAEGYEVAALHYLTKPLNKEKFFSVLIGAVEKRKKNGKILTFDLSGEMVRVPIWQIIYAEVQLNYVTIHTKEDIRIKMTLSSLQRELDDRFYRVGRSVIVNLTQVRRVTRSDIYLAGDIVLPLPRGAYEGLNRAIIQMG